MNGPAEIGLRTAVMEGNEAAARIAHLTSEVIAIYPITPSSPMGELADQWSSEGKTNLWGAVPRVQEMQSEGGAAGAIHGALQSGALTTTFTASQGLLLMIPNMYKIAGELTPTVFHVAARSLATHALSIFCDHSDVMAARATGFALLASASVQECMDLALIAQTATLEARVPFVHFFDGFRTSHEISRVEPLSREDVRAMIPEEKVREFRLRALSPERPVVRGTAQNPDVFFQSREACNPFYESCPGVVQERMDRFAERTGRRYRLFDYHGAPDAERVIVVMCSGGEAVRETVDYLTERGEKVGMVQVRLYRPFSVTHFVEALPRSTRTVAVLDRTKEPGASGEPLYLDVVNALAEEGAEAGFEPLPRVLGGRYGLSSKEFTPAMICAVFAEAARGKPRRHFTVGIRDDLTHASLDYDPEFRLEPEDTHRSVFFGLGSDGTVSANKNSIRILGGETDLYVQGYFVYDSKKAGAVTVSHLRFGPRPIRSSYLIAQAGFVGCHQFQFLERHDVLKTAAPGAVFLLNSPFGPDRVWERLPEAVRRTIREKKLRFYVLDAYCAARQAGLGGRINTIMQTAYFALSGILPREKAVQAIKDSIAATYGKKGSPVVEMNFRAVDSALDHLHEVPVPDEAQESAEVPITSDTGGTAAEVPEFVGRVTLPVIGGAGDDLPVSLLPADGTFPVGTSRWEKRNIAQEIPVWDPEICIQCGKCAMVCPHSVIRIKVYDANLLKNAPETFLATEARDREWKGLRYTIQVAPEDCTGCGICVDVCPVRNKSETRLKAVNMSPQAPLRVPERENWDFFLGLPELDRNRVKRTQVRTSQVLEPLFEFSGACAGCGETPYIKLLTQLFGDRAMVANATGCSSIYGGNLPTTPWTSNREGRGPAWSNSLFEDNAEFGLGFRLAVDQQAEYARSILRSLEDQLDPELLRGLLEAPQIDEADIFDQRERVGILRKRLREIDSPQARELDTVADLLVRRSVWIVGGDGWAYDIGFGGLDHVLTSGHNVNVLVLDTEVYSNTGGQMSKATPRGAVAKFAASGKSLAKKDLGLIAMTYGSCYVASVAVGGKDEQTLKAFLEAEAYDGPSLILAYSHCIAHGIDMTTAMQNQKAAVLSGYWPLYRYDPRRALEGKNPLQLDSRKPRLPVEEYANLENRFRMLFRVNPQDARRLLALAQEDVDRRYRIYEHLSRIPYDSGAEQERGDEKPEKEPEETTVP